MEVRAGGEKCGRSTELREGEKGGKTHRGKEEKLEKRIVIKKSEGIRDEEYNVPDFIVDRRSVPSKRYKKIGLLGTGGFAKVFKVMDLSHGWMLADKIISKEIFKRKANAKEKVENEINIHLAMNHQNIVKFIKCFDDDQYIHMILEYCSQKTLHHVLQNRITITEPEARYYLKQIMEGTRYIHMKNVLHRDLKLGNMFLHRNMTLKIGDFGLATTFRDNKPGSLCGTPNYIAPEVLSKKGHGMSADIWAIGCMLYAMLCGAPPFETKSLTVTYNRIQAGQFEIPEERQLSKNAREIILQMLSPEPDLRGHLALPDRQEDYLEDLFLHPFMGDFTPICLPSSAVRTEPSFESDIIALSTASNHSKSSAISITGRRSTNEGDGGCGSFSPMFTNNNVLGIKQKIGSLFEKKGRFLSRVLDSLTHCVEEAPLTEDGKCGAPLREFMPTFVCKWVDFTNQFGFGFQLSDNSVGLLINDATKIGCTKDRSMVEFADLKGKVFMFPLNGPTPFESCELKSRVVMLNTVIKYMQTHLQDSGAVLQGLTHLPFQTKSLVPQLKRWQQRSGAVSMEINNHTVQVNYIGKHIKVVLFEHNGEVHVTILDNSESRGGKVNPADGVDLPVSGPVARGASTYAVVAAASAKIAPALGGASTSSPVAGLQCLAATAASPVRGAKSAAVSDSRAASPHIGICSTAQKGVSAAAATPVNGVDGGGEVGLPAVQTYSLSSLISLGCPVSVHAWLVLTLSELRSLAEKDY